MLKRRIILFLCSTLLLNGFLFIACMSAPDLESKPEENSYDFIFGLQLA